MSKRLASFNGPSTPSHSPVQARVQPASPRSPSKATESTFHRKVRTLLQELRTVTRTWDELVKQDGLRALTTLTDTRTDLSNTLRMHTGKELPRTHIVGPRLDIMEKCIADLEIVITKLRKQFTKMSNIMASLEEQVTEAHKAKGWAWVETEPLWCTWTLEKFASAMPCLLNPYHRSLQSRIYIVSKLKSHSIPFEESRILVNLWASQPELDDEWVADWEDLCAVEVEKWIGR